jgi:GNAT superfamily N-acetyltransferase
VQWTRADGVFITDDRDRVDVPTVHRWLSEESYWAAGRSIDVVAKSIEQSLTLGCFNSAGAQVGFARWVTDGATFGWLCDVFVDSSIRGRGIGSFLVQKAVEHPEVQGLRLRLLGTRDAHDLYRQFGFVEVREPHRWMELRPK